MNDRYSLDVIDSDLSEVDDFSQESINSLVAALLYIAASFLLAVVIFVPLYFGFWR